MTSGIIVEGEREKVPLALNFELSENFRKCSCCKIMFVQKMENLNLKNSHFEKI